MYSLICLLLILCGCSGLEQSEQEKLRRLNATGEFISRNHDEILYAIPPPKYRSRPKYPWEETYVGKLPKITKEFFRCKGSSSNPPFLQRAENRFDCGGREKHSLPLRENKEFIYPILMEMLNDLQVKTGKKVVITCGYRCPVHNAYADDSAFNQTSKHMVGAEVDFYVRGMEHRPEEVVQLLMQFFKQSPLYRGKKEYEEFARYERSDTNVSTPPWYNKEILIKLFKKDEGRDFDNRHSYPYLSLQVRHDRDLNERVIYTWPKANTGYMRY